jgi:HEAT repeat protein
MQMVGEVVRSIAVAWKSVRAYPPDHPAVMSAVAAAQRSLDGHLLGTHRLALGAARDGLIHGTDKLSFTLARELAEVLYSRDVAIVVFEEGLDAGELSAFLRLLAADITTGSARPLAEDLAAAGGLKHVRIESVDFSGIRATEDLAEPGPKQVSLWEEILRSVLVGKTLSEDGLRLLGRGQPLSAPIMATLLEDCLRQLGGGAGSAGGVQLARELGEAVGRHLGRSKGGILRREVAQQIVDLARGLPPALRETLLEAALRVLATDEEQPDPLRLVAEAFEPDVMMRAFQRLGLSGVRLSRHGLQVLEALSRSARPQPRPGTADAALVRELSVLFREEDIDRHSPADHQTLLKAASSLELPAVSQALVPKNDAAPRLVTVTEGALSRTLAASLLETLRRQGSREGFEAVLRRLEELYRSLLRQNQVEQAVEVAESLREQREQPGSSGMEQRVAETMARLASGAFVPLLVDALARTGPEAPGLVRRLGEALGPVVIRNLLLTLASEQDRMRRRRIFDTLTSLGPSIVDHATLLLQDPRWFVLRNMIALLRAVGDLTTLPQVRRLAEHADLRVRLEAIKSLFRLDASVPRTLLDDLIASADPKEAEAAVDLVGNYGIVEGLGPLLALLEPRDLRGRRHSLRVKVLRALGELGNPAALDRLGRFFKVSGLTLVNAEERRAAFESLAGYPWEARAPVVQRGLHARDPKIREACQRLAREDAGAREQAEAS